MSQMKEQDKTLEKDINVMEINHPPGKVFKVMVIKMLTKLRRRVNEISENFSKRIENISFKQVTELKNIMTEL